ncbi:response regulator [Pseudomonas corrugata]|uniref:response regulator n=1 Tax=Pseudomonas corrugata TaxID=47879 RepID=UPI00222EF44F|nr:response regulator [Pseudomonas corrugata]UZD97710.1 response regulator [Pseudomonas corrugata]
MNVNWEGLQPIRGEVIVIEDDPTLQSLLTNIMVEIGARTIAFDTADDALTYLLEGHGQCALVIADHGVPGQVKGIEFIEMVKSRWSHIAAILTSGYQIELGAVPADTIYLHKPWSLDEMVIAVAALLQPRSPIQKS